MTAAGQTTYREALRAAMQEAMREDPRVFLMGEDVGRYGGCYGVSAGMLSLVLPGLASAQPWAACDRSWKS